ncbi:hypothetical protein MHU86_19060 [Fragilaria crotonensis]|nr:hypothetical protein MHU86_19060 [Fragilaria crotonensis]
MRFIFHLALLAGASVANLFIANAIPHNALTAALMKNARRLNGIATSYDSQVDLSSYVVKFQKCFERAVVFKLCPASDCDACTTNYGEYLIELERYLEVTVAHAKELEDDMCYACAECGGDNQSVHVDCSTCADECEKISNMMANGYLDASVFLECQLIYDPADDSISPLWAGPVCTAAGSKIIIGVFTDSDCTILDATKDVDDYLLNPDGMQVKISHALLKTVYSANCISCAQEDRNGSNSQALEMCGTLHEYAAKCEAIHGFAGGNAGVNNSYNVMIAHEATACGIIDSITNRTNRTSGEVSNFWIGSSSSDSGGETETTVDIYANLTSYAVTFEKCIDYQAFSTQLAADQQEYAAAFDGNFVVLFKVCPASECNACTSNYGEYLIDLDAYLDVAVAHAKDLQDDMCVACAECGGDNQSWHVDCSTCADECEKIRNMEANGYIDASIFIQCQMIYDPPDDSEYPLWAGPVCTTSGSKITIGVFTDSDCTTLDATKDVEDYLIDSDGNSFKLSHALLTTAYSNCMSCAQEDMNGRISQALKRCRTLFEDAGACEAAQGFTNGNSPVCDIINSATNGTNMTSGQQEPTAETQPSIESSGSGSGGETDPTLGNSATSLTSYTVKFEKCIDNQASDVNARLPVDQDHFKPVVVFKLCPANDCAACTSDYGEYLIDLETYLEVSIERSKQEQEIACDACGDCSADRRVRRLLDIDCTTCADECEKIINMEANGYLDASDFIQCQLIYDPPDDSEYPLWAGPLCTSSGSKITIGVFTDMECTEHDSTKDVDNYLVSSDGSFMKLSHALLKTTYEESCRSCAQEYTRHGEFLSDMCGILHEYASAKCEAMHGFAGGNANGDSNSHNVLIVQEASDCDMIHSMTNRTFTSSDSGAGVEGESDTEDEGVASISNMTSPVGNSSSGGEVNITTNNTGTSRNGGMETNQTAEDAAYISGEQGNTEFRAANSTSGGRKVVLALTALGTVFFAMLF